MIAPLLLLVAALGGVAMAFRPMLSRAVRKYDGPEGEVTETDETWVPEIREAGKWLSVIGACAFLGGGGALGLAIMGGRTASGTTASAPVGAPNTPAVAVSVSDTSTWYVSFSTFVGSGGDTQDSIAVTVLRSGAADTLFHAVSGVQLVDTVSDNADLKADTTYRVLGRQKGASGGWSVADTVSVVNTAIPAVSGTVRFDTRSGGAQDIQAGGVTTYAQALTATGFTDYNPDNGDIDFTTDADGTGENAFRFDWAGTAAATETNLMIYRALGTVSNAETYVQFKIWQTKTASGGGIGTAGDWDCCSQGPGSGKRIAWFKSPSNTGKFTFAPGTGNPQTGQFFIEPSGAPIAHNPSYASVAVEWNNFVSQWITLTFRLKSETSNGAADGIMEGWFNGTKIFSDVTAETETGAWDGQFEIGGPTWRGVPQDQTMYVKDIVVWQP